MIFLRFAKTRFEQRRAELAGTRSRRGGSRVDDPGAYHAEGVMPFKVIELANMIGDG